MINVFCSAAQFAVLCYGSPGEESGMVVEPGKRLFQGNTMQEDEVGL